ncbi:hypothetical protein D9611_013558 [Ephemerocybe angulata]|uniref:Uncharacterized protein n=1 Tax=Ephemerocybe angulata TaxID=980116 RepID=A0A8H5FFB8_9AGAR|nr:hypothetical protein D9611_013558 [Tulosesus angulatus]
MPAPAIYGLAVVGTFATIGALLAFKEFIYEPLIHPHVVRITEEFQENRRQRRLSRPHAQHHASDSDSDDEDNRPLMSTTTSARRLQSPQQQQQNLRFRRPRNQGGNGAGDNRDNAHHAATPGDYRYGPPYTPRRPPGHAAEIELADLAPEVREWRASTLMGGPGVRESPRSALDESNLSISFAPLQPTRGPNTNVTPSSNATVILPSHREDVFGLRLARSPPRTPTTNSSSTTAASTPTASPSMHRRMQDLPRVPETAPRPAAASTVERRPTSPAATDLSSLVASPALPTFAALQPAPAPRRTLTGPSTSSLSTLVTSPPLPAGGAPTGNLDEVTPIATRPTTNAPLGYSSPGVSPTQPYRRAFPLSATRTPTSPTARQPSSSSSSYYSTAASQSHSSPHLAARTEDIPSLSQTHPDLLDYEHGIELLSPPSSRSESPFSVVGGTSSPNLGDPTPHGTPGSTATTSAYLSLSEEESESDANPAHQSSSSSRNDAFDFDLLTSSTPSSPQPSAPDSPFSMSPFASPRLAPHTSTSPQGQIMTGTATQAQLLSLGGSGRGSARPVSPAVSTTSTTFSELEAESEGWSDVDGAEALDREIETLGFTRTGTGTLRRK